MRTAKIAVLLAAMALGACARQRTESTIARRHAAEFGCAPEQVTVTEIDYNWNHNQGQFAGEGCGTRAIYVCAQGTCVRDSEAQPAQ